jgi:uncharacterized protein YicC (UPF0701 family)
MATSTKTNTALPDFEAATEANDRLAEVGRKVTTAYLDGVEKYVSRVAQFERQLGDQTKVDAVASLLSTHADLAEEITKVSVSAARELITA